MASSLSYAASPQIVVTQTIRSCGREPVAFRRACARGIASRVSLAAALITRIQYLNPDISWAEYLTPPQRQIRRNSGTQCFKLAFAEIGCNESALPQRK